MTEEIVPKGELWQLSNIEKAELAKSQILLITNLANRMTASQNILFSFALMHANVGEDYAESEFALTDLSGFLQNQNYEKYDTRRILKDLQKVAENNILRFNEEMISNPKNGKAKGIMIFSDYEYDKGRIHFTFNSTPVLIGGQRRKPILELLHSKEENPLIYNLSTFSKLNSRGQSLYEHLLVATANNKQTLKLNLEELRIIFKASGKSMERFNALKIKHLVPALESINEFTDLDVKMVPFKEGRRIIGVELYWSQEKVKLPATDKQINLMHELFVQLSKYNFTADKDLRLLNQLKNGQLLDRHKAGKLIFQATSIRNTLSSGEHLDDNNKISEEYTYFFDKFLQITEKSKIGIISNLNRFPESERLSLLDYAYKIYLQNGAKSINYIIRILEEWANNNVKSVMEAVSLHDQNYGDSYEPLPEDIEVSVDFLDALNLWKDEN